MLQKFYKTPFICLNIHVGFQRVSQEWLCVLAGEGQMHIIKIDPDSKHFADVATTRFLTRKKRSIVQANVQSDKNDLISNVIFSESFGIIMTFFSGQFKMFEPVKFKQTWHQETADG